MAGCLGSLRLDASKTAAVLHHLATMSKVADLHLSPVTHFATEDAVWARVGARCDAFHDTEPFLLPGVLQSDPFGIFLSSAERVDDVLAKAPAILRPVINALGLLPPQVVLGNTPGSAQALDIASALPKLNLALVSQLALLRCRWRRHLLFWPLMSWWIIGPSRSL